MDQFTNEELLELIRKATAGDRKALETVLVSVQDLVFNPALRGRDAFRITIRHCPPVRVTGYPQIFPKLSPFSAGDRKALETVLVSVQDLVFNLSLRMLGTFPDAEDATQDSTFCVRSGTSRMSAFLMSSP
mgnify:CR=1 FL=1